MEILSRGQSSGELLRTFDGNGLIVNFVSYYETTCQLGLHYHINPHLSYVFSGSDIELKNKNQLCRKPGEAYFYASGEPHQTLRRKEPLQNIIIELTPQYLKRFEVNEDVIGNVVQHDEMNIMMSNLVQSMSLGIAETELEFMMLEILGLGKDEIEDVRPNWTRLVRDFLHENWNRTINLDELSRVADLHTVTISKNFRKYFKFNFAEYRRRIRIERAIPMIKESKHSLTEIAYYCGFSDQSHFVRVFKEVTNVLPNEFKNVDLSKH